VTALVRGDAERLLRFVADAGQLVGDEPFGPTILEELGKLVRADNVTYCEQDRLRQRIRYEAVRHGDEGRDRIVSYWDIAVEHPVCAYHDTGDVRALKLSDFLTLKELRRTHIYAVWFHPAGFEHELAVGIPSPAWYTKTFLFARERRDFTERDRLVLDLLQPHLGHLWRAAHTRRQLHAALTGLEWTSEDDPHGVILLAPDGCIEYTSAPASRLLRVYFGSQRGAELPPALAEWLESGSATFTRRLDDRSLTAQRSGDAVLLGETRPLLGLTSREREILSWVARGKKNAEIAQTLWIAPSTVRKHLENVYAKLGVRTRTEAAARFLGMIEP
jgi:DNA-binding CsgD family transcriptional regulator